MHSVQWTRSALFVASASFLTGTACSLIFPFHPCETDAHCFDGEVCSQQQCVPSDIADGSDTGESDTGGGPCSEDVEGPITQDTVWEDCEYHLREVIYVENGATLTVRAGTQVFGDEGSALVITSGSRLDSRGTEFSPVVFTSAQPEGMRTPGDWGGVALLGRAVVNEPNAVLEGLTDASRAAYGGTDDDWSCGVLEYTRIEFAGFPLQTDNELNGLTLGGCGSGTLIQNVQVHLGNDDGVEVFGGTVNLSRVVISRAQDDSLDWDRGWRGKAQFLAIIQDSGGDNAIECDNWGDMEDADPRSSPTIYNATLIGSNDPAASQRGATFKAGTAGTLRNFIFMGHPIESIDVKTEATVAQVESGGLTVGSSVFFQAGDDGNHFFPTLADEAIDDDDGAFDEDMAFRSDGLGNQFGLDPSITNAYNLTTPGWVPGSVINDTGVAPPGDGFFEEAADYTGAFAPGALPWTENWTAFPEN